MRTTQAKQTHYQHLTMKNTLSIAWLFLVLCLSCSAGLTELPRLREWKDIDGKVIKALYLDHNEDEVELSVAGKAYTVPLSRLSKADLDWLTKAATERELAKKNGVWELVKVSGFTFDDDYDVIFNADGTADFVSRDLLMKSVRGSYQLKGRKLVIHGHWRDHFCEIKKKGEGMLIVKKGGRVLAPQDPWTIGKKAAEERKRLKAKAFLEGEQETPAKK